MAKKKQKVEQPEPAPTNPNLVLVLRSVPGTGYMAGDTVLIGASEQHRLAGWERKGYVKRLVTLEAEAAQRQAEVEQDPGDETPED